MNLKNAPFEYHGAFRVPLYRHSSHLTVLLFTAITESTLTVMKVRLCWEVLTARVQDLLLGFF